MKALLPQWTAGCTDAIALLQESENLPTPQMMDLCTAALRKVAQVRDGMIDSLRAEPPAPHVDLWQTALNEVNTALSVISTVVYPGALTRVHITSACTLLQRLIAESEPYVKEMEPLEVAAGITGRIEGGLADEDVHRIAATSESPPETQRL